MTVRGTSLVGKILEDSFEVVELISDKGGMCYVFEGKVVKVPERLKLRGIEEGKEVAIKVPKNPFDVSQKERLDREGNYLFRARHSSIVDFLMLGEDREIGSYLVMELLKPVIKFDKIVREETSDGFGLMAEFDDKNVSYGPEEVAQIAYHVAEALEFIHGKEIKMIHNDIKPTNIMVLDEGVKLCDLGLAKLTEISKKDIDKVTQTQQIVGSPSYMSPEQVDPYKIVDSRSDMWMLGAALYHIATGYTLFEGYPHIFDRPDSTTDMSIVAARIINELSEPSREIISPLERNPDLPYDLGVMIMGLLDWYPSWRFSASDVKELGLEYFDLQGTNVRSKNFEKKIKRAIKRLEGEWFLPKKPISLKTVAWASGLAAVVLGFTGYVGYDQYRKFETECKRIREEKQELAEKKARKETLELKIAKEEVDIIKGDYLIDPEIASIMRTLTVEEAKPFEVRYDGVTRLAEIGKRLGENIDEMNAKEAEVFLTGIKTEMSKADPDLLNEGLKKVYQSFGERLETKVRGISERKIKYEVGELLKNIRTKIEENNYADADTLIKKADELMKEREDKYSIEIKDLTKLKLKIVENDSTINAYRSSEDLMDILDNFCDSVQCDLVSGQPLGDNQEKAIKWLEKARAGYESFRDSEIISKEHKRSLLGRIKSIDEDIAMWPAREFAFRIVNPLRKEYDGFVENVKKEDISKESVSGLLDKRTSALKTLEVLKNEKKVDERSYASLRSIVVAEEDIKGLYAERIRHGTRILASYGEELLKKGEYNENDIEEIKKRRIGFSLDAMNLGYVEEKTHTELCDGIKSVIDVIQLLNIQLEERKRKQRDKPIIPQDPKNLIEELEGTFYKPGNSLTIYEA